jgi:hypothetical protein
VSASDDVYNRLPPAVQELVLQYKAFLAAQADGDDSMIYEEFRKREREREGERESKKKKKQTRKEEERKRRTLVYRRLSS